MKRSKKCPECSWNYPIFAPPSRRHNGVGFNCPNCGAALIYYTGLGEKSKGVTLFFVAIALPVVLLFQQFDDNMALQVKIAAPLVAIAIVALVYFMRSEYIVRKDEDQVP